MNERWERFLSTVVAVSAAVVALVVVKREVFTRPAPPRAQQDAAKTFVSSWRDLVPAARIHGDATAKVTILEFADVECPFCRRFNQDLRTVQAQFPRDVAVGFIHLPLKMHRFARPGARAAECAADEGKFFDVIDLLFEKQDRLGLKPWTEFARDAGVRDSSRFRMCARDTSQVAQIETGVALASRLGVSATPTVIVNGWRFGQPPADTELVRVVRALLADRKPFP